MSLSSAKQDILAESEEPPSKRPRLEMERKTASEPETPMDEDDDFDDLDDLYGTPQKPHGKSDQASQFSRSVNPRGSPEPTEIPLSLIPGLGFVQPNTATQEPTLTTNTGNEEHRIPTLNAAPIDQGILQEPGLVFSLPGLSQPPATITEAPSELRRTETKHNNHEDGSQSDEIYHAPINEPILNGSGMNPPLNKTLTEASAIPSTNSYLQDPHSNHFPSLEQKLPEESQPVKPPDVAIEGDDGEFRFDSSDAQSTSSDDTSSSGSDGSDDEEDKEEYNLLSVEEQAKILMAGDGGSDDEGGKRNGKPAEAAQLRTKNEIPDEKVEKPEVVVTQQMKIEELGSVESVIGNVALVKANTSGEYRVLESGSVLCLGDRTVIGVVADLMGQVMQPRYTIRFTNATEVAETGIAAGTKIFYVEAHSTFVFTKPLQAIKGSDASNFYDEEVGDDEVEFSDDEAEAEHKRRIKEARQARRGDRQDPNSTATRFNGQHQAVEAEDTIHYDDRPNANSEDGEVDDDLYTPLARPSNLHELMGRGEAPIETRDHANRGRRPGKGQDRARARGGRDRGGRDRGGRDRGGRDGGGRDGGGRDGGRGSRRDGPRERHGRGRERQKQRRKFDRSPQDHRQGRDDNYSRRPDDGYDPRRPFENDQAQRVQREHSRDPPYHQNNSYRDSRQSHSPMPQVPPPQHVQYTPYAPPRPEAYPIAQIQSSWGQYAPPPPALPYMPQTPGSLVPPQGAPSPSNIRPGAFLNPAFFNNAPQANDQAPWSPPVPQQVHWGTSPPAQLPPWMPPPQVWPQSPHVQSPTGVSTGRGMSPTSEAAFRAAQEKIDIIRGLSRPSGSP
ncbi:MAG: hypothetical protein M1824_003288 [Vezdaea acicularis]|nr:MAG: hypothetical protein M1824_003288 [Vezdaea acicularis]